MFGTPFDPTDHKTRQREEWNAAAPGWQRRWPAYERAARSLSDRMLEIARIAPGMRVLDVATGIGEPALTAARRVGPAGSVVALDQASAMLAVARERVHAAGLSNVELIEGDAETVALPLDAFDAIVCRWGIFFFPDPVGTLAHLRASLIPGGRLVAAVWGPPQQVPLISLSFRALAGELGRPPTPPAGPNPFALSEPAALAQVLHDAGYTDVGTERCTVTFEFASADEVVGHLTDVSAPARAALATRGPEQQAEFRARLAAVASPYAGADGGVRLPNAVLIATGQR